MIMEDHKNQTAEFRKLLNESRKILVASHISPDPDAVCSVLLLGTTLKANFPDKKVRLVLEEKPARSLSFLEDYQEIEFRQVLEAANEIKPDLFILLDAPNFERISRRHGDELRRNLGEMGSKVAIIDHHEERGKDKSDVYINNLRPATAQEVYELLFKDLQFKKPNGYAQTTLLGIISDTDRHKFDNPVHRETYRIVSDLLDAGASIEELETSMERYDADQLKVLNNLISNIADSGQGYTYSFIDDELAKDWLKTAKSPDSFKLASEQFTQQFLKKFENNLWGFIVYIDIASGEGVYGVSLRSASKIKDVSKIAHMLGGGGHKPAAGAKFKADNISQALEKVKKTISGADDED